MARTPTSNQQPGTDDQQPLVPPDERFWQRYSPHHEFPVSATGSLTLHVLLLCLLFGAIPFGLLGGCYQDVDSPTAPPRMAVVEIDGAYGDFDGLGFGKSLFSPGATKRTEFDGSGGVTGQGKAGPKDVASAINLENPILPRPKIDLPEPGGTEPPDDGAFAELNKAVKQVEEQVAMALNPGVVVKPGHPGGKDTTTKIGSPGGPKGKGKGTGLTGDGPGAGSSPYGQVLNNQQKRAMRWKILASDDGLKHLGKLKALKVTLVVPTRNPSVFKVMDLARQPAAFETKSGLSDQGGKVWWTNRHPQQVQALAQVLRIDTPPCFVILLPKSLEERMLQLEQAHQGAREAEVHLTVWDIPERDGHFAQEPVIVEQILKGQR